MEQNLLASFCNTENAKSRLIEIHFSATQYTALQTLTFADMPGATLSRSTSLASVVQQLAQGLGISISATLLGLIAGSASELTVRDFHLAFLAIAAMSMMALPGFLGLSGQDGEQVSHHHRRPVPAE